MINEFFDARDERIKQNENALTTSRLNLKYGKKMKHISWLVT